jgi:hypothetical protein
MDCSVLDSFFYPGDYLGCKVASFLEALHRRQLLFILQDHTSVEKFMTRFCVAVIRVYKIFETMIYNISRCKSMRANYLKAVNMHPEAWVGITCMT